MNITQPDTLFQITRRHWLQLLSLAIAVFCVPGSVWSKGERKLPYQYWLAQVELLPFSLPQNKTVPFDWPVAEIPADGKMVFLKWNSKTVPTNKTFRLRITSATDVREACMLEISLAGSEQKIGNVNIQFAHYMQPFEIEIPTEQLPQILVQGITLRMVKGTKPFWFFIRNEKINKVPDAYLPHLLVSGAAADNGAWKNRLSSLSSLSTFGWMEGCVLDGLSMMAAQDATAKKMLGVHLQKYFANNTLVYENLNNQRSSEKISTVESILPFAMLAMENFNHAMLQTAIEFCSAHADKNGVVADDAGTDRTLKTEECYTIAYPLAILAKKLNRPELEQMAIANLSARVKLLFDNNIIYQRAKESGKQEFGNWARGAGWYLLGLAKTLTVLPQNEATQPLRSAFVDGMVLVLKYQQPTGLWNCFLHQPETGIETSGSAIIAAAMAYGYSQKLLPVAYKEAAEKCRAGLQKYFTPDGFLTGTAQVNKGGESLQRNGFRVISPYTLGFIGILEASLGMR